MSQADLSGFYQNVAAGILLSEERELADALIAEDQQHLFAEWDAPGTRDDEKKRYLETLLTSHRSYPGGLPAYIRNARGLLADAAAARNPFEGCMPEQPNLIDLSQFGADYEKAEQVGFQQFANTAVVLVAGGLGERLGYQGIKLDIPVEVTESTSYLAHYASVIRAASVRLGREIPLVIMTSRDTHEGTVATLAEHANFGLGSEQITILRQELVPALADVSAHLALEKKYEIVLKPHGHGDIHMLLHTSGTAAKLSNSGTRFLLFIQDTNGQVFNAAFAAIGISETERYDFNSIAVNRVPGEAVGGIARLVRENGSSLTLNVEYNQLDPLLRATVNPDGDVPNEHGFSLFPGNINLLVIRMEPYLRVLESSQGIIAEFINPKFSDAERTAFKKPARLETMMQDLPKLFTSGEKVGVTVFERTWCFSACKNNLADAAEKAEKNGPPESASSAESDFYRTARTKLKMSGMAVQETPREDIRGVPIVRGPRVILRPSFALILADVRERIRGGSISGASTLVLEGDVTLRNVTLADGAALVVSAAPGAQVSVADLTIAGGPGFDLVELTDKEMASRDVPEFLRIRGYRIIDQGVTTYKVTSPGSWKIAADGSLLAA